MRSFAGELRIAELAAVEAGTALAKKYGSAPSGVRIKDGRASELVSDADLTADAVIRSVLLDAYPDDGIFSEEAAPTPGGAGRRWVIDPLDGTTNFLYGVPLWAVSIALEQDGQVLVGTVYDPLRDELFSSSSHTIGGGVRLGVLTDHGIDESVVSCLLGTRRAADRRIQAFLGQLRGKREFGATALELAWVAAGRLDGCLYYRGSTPWDWMAGERLIIDAGGVVIPQPFDGADFTFAGSPALAAALSQYG